MQDISSVIDISGIYFYIDKGIRPCILRAWNNYHGYQKYDLTIHNLEYTRNGFYKYIPPLCATFAFPSHYFHLFVLHNWLQQLHATTLFVAKNAHIYCIKYEQSIHKWIHYDWPIYKIYGTLWEVQRSLADTRYVILLYPFNKKVVLQRIFQSWSPPPTPYYQSFQQSIEGALRDNPRT